MGYDISGLFTDSVREVAPMALAKGQAFSFDYSGPRAVLNSDREAMKRSLRRVFHALMDLVGAGLLVFEAKVRLTLSGACEFSLRAAGFGRPSLVDSQNTVVARLGLRDSQGPTAGGRPSLRRAFGSCPHTGAAIEFSSHRAAGVSFMLRLVTQERPGDAARQIDSSLPRAKRVWLVHDDAALGPSLMPRLQRLGCVTVAFRSPVKLPSFCARRWTA